MTPYQKAVEAAAKARFERKFDVPWASASRAQQSYWMREAQLYLDAGLASARESGWELKPRDCYLRQLGAGSTATDVRLWANMFDAAPRFEDAP